MNGFAETATISVIIAATGALIIFESVAAAIFAACMQAGCAIILSEIP